MTGITEQDPWWWRHVPECGTTYRGCAPSCPKDARERAQAARQAAVSERRIKVTSCVGCPFARPVQGERHHRCAIDEAGREIRGNRPDWCPLRLGPVVVEEALPFTAVEGVVSLVREDHGRAARPRRGEALSPLLAPGVSSVVPKPEVQAMNPPAPPRVEDMERYWSEQPPTLSDRCTWWVSRFAQGWRPNRRIRSLGYWDAAGYYGVYLWEYLNVIGPIEREADA